MIAALLIALILFQVVQIYRRAAEFERDNTVILCSRRTPDGEWIVEHSYKRTVRASAQPDLVASPRLEEVGEGAS